MSAPTEVVTLCGATGIYMRGLRLDDSRGRRWIVTGSSSTELTIKPATWWRRMYWRVRRALARA